MFELIVNDGCHDCKSLLPAGIARLGRYQAVEATLDGILKQGKAKKPRMNPCPIEPPSPWPSESLWLQLGSEATGF
eukprot:5738703-Amphidinium_carterae.1